jgi:hypothetical protein
MMTKFQFEIPEKVEANNETNTSFLPDFSAKEGREGTFKPIITL